MTLPQIIMATRVRLVIIFYSCSFISNSFHLFGSEPDWRMYVENVCRGPSPKTWGLKLLIFGWAYDDI